MNIKLSGNISDNRLEKGFAYVPFRATNLLLEMFFDFQGEIKMLHSFDIDIAQKFGINQAIILNHLYFWIEKNRANEKHFHDGHYWTYSTTKALTKIFPYMTDKQIKYALSKLVEFGLIIKGNYNNSPYDRTNWFAITAEGYSHLQNKTLELSSGQNCPIERKNLSNEKDNNVQPIPDILTNNIHILTRAREENKKEKNVPLAENTYIRTIKPERYNSSGRKVCQAPSYDLEDYEQNDDFYEMLSKRR